MKKFLVTGLVLGLACIAFAEGSSVSLQKTDLKAGSTQGNVTVSLDPVKEAPAKGTPSSDTPVYEAPSLQAIGDVAQITASNLFWAEQEIVDLKDQGLPIPAYLYRAVREYYGLPDFDLPLDRQGGEDIATATVIAGLPHSSVGTTIGYVDNYDEVCPYTGSTSPDVVYSFTPGANVAVDITLCNGSDYDTKLYVYENAWTPGAPFACNDDTCPGWVSELTDLNLTGGNTYYIVVDGYYGASGNYVLDITEDVWVDPPPNDDCANAEAITGPYPVAVTGTMAGATVDCAGLLDWNAVWYTIDLPYVLNSVLIDWCDMACAPTNYGIILMDDCACDDYIIGSYGWTCANGNLENLFEVAGPGTIYFPHFIEGCEDFTFNVNVTEVAPCEIVCPEPNTPEFEELCYDEYVDVTNGGCNSIPAVFGTIACGETICGESGTFLVAGAQNRDTDWFLFTIAETSTVTVTGEAEFDVLLGIVTDVPGCTAPAFATSITGADCQVITTSTILGAGSYAVWVGPSVFTGVPCGASYWATLTCEPFVVEQGDMCSDPFIVTALPYQYFGTTTDNLDSYGNPAPDEWHQFTLAAAGEVTMSLCGGGTTYDSYLYLLADDCATQLAYNDDFCGLQSEITMGLSAGTYNLAVDGYSSNSGAYQLDITLGEPCVVTCPDPSTPEGEETCYDEYEDVTNGGCNSIPPVFGAIDCGETVCGTSGTFLYGGSSYRDTDWYMFSLAEDMTVTLTGEAEFDFLLGFVNDVPGCVAPAFVSSASGEMCTPVTVVANLMAGDYAVFAAPSVFTGVPCGAVYYATITSCVPWTPGEGDTIGTALPYDLGGPCVQGTTIGMVDDYDEVCPYTGSTSPDAVWYIDLDHLATLDFDICNSDYDTKIYVYNSALALMGCNDDFCNDPMGNPYRSFLSILNMPVDTYYIVVDGYGGASGNYELCVTELAPFEYGNCQMPPTDPAGTWSFGTSHNDGAGTDYYRAERFGQGGVITDLQFVGLSLIYDAGWTPCEVFPMDFHIDFYADGGGVPGALVHTEDVALTGVFTGDVYAGVYNSYAFDMTLSAPVNLVDGWVGVQSFGDATACWFLWASTDLIYDGSSYMTNAGVPADYFYDNAFCLTVGAPPCDAPDVSITYNSGVAVLTMAGGDGDFFNIYKSAAPYSGFVLVATIPNAVGDDLWIDAEAGNYFYQVTSECP